MAHLGGFHFLDPFEGIAEEAMCEFSVLRSGSQCRSLNN